MVAIVMNVLRSYFLYTWLGVFLVAGGLSACNGAGSNVSVIIKSHLDSPSIPVASNSIVVLDGWVLSTVPLQNVEVSIDGTVRLSARLDIVRPDVLATFPEHKNAFAQGFKIKLDNEQVGLHDIHQLKVDVVTAEGIRHTIGETTVISSLDKRKAVEVVEQKDIFYILFATSGAAQGGLQEIRDIYGPLESSTIKVGIRVPILYLRTTYGRDQDWNFDPNFDSSRKCGDKTIAEDSLNSVMETAIKNQLPVLFTLNGGVWADARCDVPDWDINDELEKDVLNCQWDSSNAVYPDDYLQHLPGSENSPELARSLTFNAYADKVRHYKKRNLQQVARLIRNFQLQHPHLFVGVTLDPDVYVNPFFESPPRLHDYNPNTLRQFREWLQGTGPYGPSKPFGTDLRLQRLQPSLSLQQVNAIADKNFSSWDAVEPPRPTTVELTAIYLLPDQYKWFHLWEMFRRHLVDIHYDDLSLWVKDAGIDARFIQSAQGMHENFYSAIPTHINSPLGRYDTGGASIEGAVPSHGHLGAIVYGQTSENISPQKREESLFAVFRKFDPDWAIVEFNTAHLQEPKKAADFGSAYRALRDSFNYGARYVSPMAWNGSNGIFAKDPNYVAYTSVRNTPLDIVIRRLMRTHANLPRGAKLWTFGSQQHPDSDGWTVNQGAPMLQNGGVNFAFAGAAKRTHTLESPRELYLSAEHFDLRLQTKPAASLTIESLEGREDPTVPWTVLKWQARDAGSDTVRVQLQAGQKIDQVRMRVLTENPIRLEAIELQPAQMTN